MYVHTQGIKVDTLWLELEHWRFLHETLLEIVELRFKLSDHNLFLRNEDKNRVDMNPSYDGSGQDVFVAFSLLEKSL